jgi:hypothetical protein
MDTTEYTLVVGPDEQASDCIAWSLAVDGDHDVAGGWRTRGALYLYRLTAREWVARLRRHVRLPLAVRRAGLGWSDAAVNPNGYSYGPWCYGGIHMTWTVRS